jgi:hypothetical protein
MATILRHVATSQTLRAGKGWKDENGIQHPSNWQIWSAEEKTAAGITEVVQESPPDSRLYRWSQNRDGTINKTAKDLADSGSGDTLVLGVKSVLKLTVNTQQGSLLDQTDWYIIRKADNATAIPSNVQTWRDAIRTKGDAMVSAIDGAADTNAVAALFLVYEEDGKTIKSGILYDWPELET